MHALRQTQADLYTARTGAAVALPRAAQLPGFLLEGFTITAALRFLFTTSTRRPQILLRSAS
jgi:hypothetical protein